MKWPSRWRTRARNAFFRVIRRVPRGAISPVVRNDLFHAHQSLFEFLAAFVSNRKTLFVGKEAFGAHAISQGGAASVRAVMTTRAALRYGRRTFAAPGLEFHGDIPAGQTFDVVIQIGAMKCDLQSPVDAVQPKGKLLITATPVEDAKPWLRQKLAEKFAHVRRFVHLAGAPLDFSSPYFSEVSRTSFTLQEIAATAEVPSHAIGLVYLATNEPKWGDLQLHLGCGPIAIEGWINIDNQPYAGIDFRWDLARGIPFRFARYVFAEHFLEHLTYQQGVEFVRSCRAALRNNGILRLSTPNLDWVWQVSYHPAMWSNDDEAMRDCFVLNRAFRGWGHQFLYNMATLAALLQNAGFTMVQPFRYGESDTPALAGLERHEQYPDTPELPHVLVVEAGGRAEPQAIRGEAHIAEYNRDVAAV